MSCLLLRSTSSRPSSPKLWTVPSMRALRVLVKVASRAGMWAWSGMKSARRCMSERRSTRGMVARQVSTPSSSSCPAWATTHSYSRPRSFSFSARFSPGFSPQPSMASKDMRKASRSPSSVRIGKAARWSR